MPWPTPPPPQCHPERRHYARGQCRACFNGARYKNSKQVREGQIARSRAYYSAHRAECITAAVVRKRTRRGLQPKVVRPPAPTVVKPSVREWWKQDLPEFREKKPNRRATPLWRLLGKAA
jgi:hypothetical protein